MARIRRSVWALLADPADRTLEWYSRAVARMGTLPLADSRGWRYQAAIHEYDRANDPLAVPNEPMPSQAEQRRYWTQCQHSSWFFLPWHRMYLHHFEQIVASHVVALGGPSSWALPYWNYSRGAASRRLPTPFRAEFLPSGAANPLHVKARDPDANAGLDFISAVEVDLRPSLRAAVFAGVSGGGNPGFGGPSTGLNHGGGPVGALERTPHGDIHVAVAGATGWMRSFSRAALDPVFWLHHCNIDRLWEVWLQRDPAHRNPSAALWNSGVAFDFRNAAGTNTSMVARDVLATQPMPLDYEYDDVSDPLASPLEPMGPGEPDMAADRTPEMVGATARAFDLADRVVRAGLPTPGSAQGALESMGTDEGPQHAYLHLENLTADGDACAYDVYVGIPDGVDPGDHPERRVGRLSMFGLAEASRADGAHAGSGLTYALDITEVVERLRQAGAWNPEQMQVAFKVARGDPAARVRVGRMSVYVA